MILVTGASGQLGHAVVQRLEARGVTFNAVQRPAFDFNAPETVAACFRQVRPDLVINAAAYTAVDKAETDIEAARVGNHTGPLALARLCAAADIPLIHVSTDYVFAGDKGAPYQEADPTSPIGVYGATKRDGEEAILATPAKAIILRTAWVYSDYGRNFAKTMIAAGRKMPVLRVVADQHGTPTAAGDLADAILAITEQLKATGWCSDYRGIFHATNGGETTWYGFAQAIFEEAARHGYEPPQLEAISTSSWPTPTRRPADSRLECSKLRQVFGVELPAWRTTLAALAPALVQL